MDIISEPAFTEETVIDWEFSFSGGEPLNITLRAGDTFDQATGMIKLVAPREGIIRVYEHLVTWCSSHIRVIRTPVTGPPISATQSLGPKT